MNEIIKQNHSFNNHVELRRELINYMFLDRDSNGLRYWKSHHILKLRVESENLHIDTLAQKPGEEFIINKKIILKTTGKEIGSIRLELGVHDPKSILISDFRMQTEYLDYKNEVIEEISKIARRQGIETLVVIVHDQDELSFWMNQNFIVDNSKSDLEKTIILKKQIIEI